jgi:uncharacterized protein (TIGR00255 family)
MTGFARVRKEIEQGEIVLSLKSVNHRGLDLHFHLPPELDALENEIRGAIKNGVARGHVQIHVALVRLGSAGAAPLNRELLQAYMSAFREAAELYHLPNQPDLNDAFRVPGMLGTGVGVQEIGEELAKAVIETASEAVAVLNSVREREGAATAVELQQRCRAICALVSRMEEIRVGATGAFQKRLKEKLTDLLHASIDPQRLAQEAAILADRSDIAEELMRLRTHAGQLEAILSAGGEVGKRLDFLLQEMNRESNTVLSKTGGLGDLGLTITDLALAAKSEIDKIREQSLNLE